LLQAAGLLSFARCHGGHQILSTGRIKMSKKMSAHCTNATDYYSSASQAEFIRYSSFCNPFATSRQYRRVIKLPF
jgi:hypothetical protein